MNKKILVNIALIYTRATSVALVCLSVYSFIILHKININIVPFLMGVILIALTIQSKYYAYQMTGGISVIASWIMFGYFMPFENQESPEGLKLIFVISVMIFFIVMAGLCFSVKEDRSE